MSMTIRSKVVKIGNSRGIRIPRSLLEQAGLTDDVEMTVEDNKLIVHSAHAVAASLVPNLVVYYFLSNLFLKIVNKISEMLLPIMRCYIIDNS